MNIETYKGYQVRKGTFDKFVVDELPTYAAMPINEGDVILDIGANIGVFTKYASEKGAKVIAVEPDVDNMEMCVHNAPKAFAFVPSAVSPYEAWSSITLYKNPGKNKGLHSTMYSRGFLPLTVPAVAFSKLLRDYRPNKLKIDCEGAEYQFMHSADLEGVQEIIMEMHLNNASQVHSARGLRQWLIDDDFEVRQEPVIALSRRAAEKSTIAYFVRAA